MGTISFSKDMSKVEMRLYNTSSIKLPGKVMCATIQRGATSGTGISVGASIATQIEIKCEYSSWMKRGAEFYFEIWHPQYQITMYFMRFVIFDSPSVNDKIAHITAYSQIYKLQRYKFNMSLLKTKAASQNGKATFGDIVDVIKQQTGFTFEIQVYNFSVGMITEPMKYQIPSYFLESAELIKYNYTCRQMVEFVAGAFGGNCFDIYDANYSLENKDKRLGCKICVNTLSNYSIFSAITVAKGDIYKDGISVDKSDALPVDRLVINTNSGEGVEKPDYIRERQYELGRTEETSLCALEMNNPFIDWALAIDLLAIDGVSSPSTGQSVGTGKIMGRLSEVTCSSCECSIAGNVWIDETMPYSFPEPIDGKGTKYIPMEIITVIDGGMKTTFKSYGQKETDVSTSGGGQAEKLLLQYIRQEMDFIMNMDIEGSRIKESTITG